MLSKLDKERLTSDRLHRLLTEDCIRREVRDLLGAHERQFQRWRRQQLIAFRALERNPMSDIGRLALRVEGDNWNAYYAMPGTMEGALFLGSIRMGAVVDNPARKRAFMDLMQDIVGDLIEEATGERPKWNEPQSAPEYEKSGRA